MAKEKTSRFSTDLLTIDVAGKVAQVLNERELVINIGQQDGVMEGQRFKVISATPLDVRDPDTGELLGSIEREKVRVQASQVFDHMTVCKPYRAHWVGNYTLSATEQLVSAFMPPTRITETLRTDTNDLPQELTLEESIVKIGDPVVRIAGTDSDD